MVNVSLGMGKVAHCSGPECCRLETGSYASAKQALAGPTSSYTYSSFTSWKVSRWQACGQIWHQISQQSYGGSCLWFPVYRLPRGAGL